MHSTEKANNIAKAGMTTSCAQNQFAAVVAYEGWIETPFLQSETFSNRSEQIHMIDVHIGDD